MALLPRATCKLIRPTFVRNFHQKRTWGVDGNNYVTLTRGITPQTRKRHTSVMLFISSRTCRCYGTLPKVKENIVYVPVERNGVRYSLGVIDVGDLGHPVVLCSHGAPGSGEDFLNLVPALLDMKLRVIMPTYPGYDLSPLPEEDLFRLDHGDVEKAELLKLVCRHLNVPKVTMMMSHSQGTTAAYQFCSDQPVESAIFFSACGETPQSSAEPFWALRLTAKLLKNPVSRGLMSTMLLKKYKHIGFKVTDKTTVQTALMTVSSIDFSKSLPHMKTLRDKKTPVVFMIVQNDRILEWQRPFSLLQQVGFPNENIVFYDDNRDPSHIPNTELDKDWYTRAFVLAKGGHNVHKTHQDLAQRAIKDLIAFVRR